MSKSRLLRAASWWASRPAGPRTPLKIPGTYPHVAKDTEHALKNTTASKPDDMQNGTYVRVGRGVSDYSRERIVSVLRSSLVDRRLAKKSKRCR
jgi:hypothetical protein